MSDKPKFGGMLSSEELFKAIARSNAYQCAEIVNMLHASVLGLSDEDKMYAVANIGKTFVEELCLYTGVDLDKLHKKIDEAVKEIEDEK